MNKVLKYCSITVFALSLLACQNENTKQPKQVQVAELQEVLQKAAQEYSFDSKTGIEITGVEGTIIRFPANAFAYGDGTNAEGEIKVKLTEYYKASELLFTELSTETVDNKLLETGGMIYLESECNGKPVKIRSEMDFTLWFPVQGKSKQAEMSLFSGEASNNNGNIRWNKEADLFDDTDFGKGANLDDEGINLDSVSQMLERNLEYYLFKSSSLKWLNCDKYLDESEGVRLMVHADEKLKPVVRLLYKPFRTMSVGIVQADKSVVFSPLAVGADATLFAFSKVNGKIHFATKDITITGEMEVNLEFKEVTLEQLKAEAKKLEWEDVMASK